MAICGKRSITHSSTAVSAVPASMDRTAYGLSRSATRSFHTHHLRLLSLTIASALAQSFDDHADALNSQLIDGDLDLGQPTNGRAAGG